MVSPGERRLRQPPAGQRMCRGGQRGSREQRPRAERRGWRGEHRTGRRQRQTGRRPMQTVCRARWAQAPDGRHRQIRPSAARPAPMPRDDGYRWRAVRQVHCGPGRHVRWGPSRSMRRWAPRQTGGPRRSERPRAHRPTGGTSTLRRLRQKPRGQRSVPHGSRPAPRGHR